MRFYYFTIWRGSRPDVLYKKCVLRNFAKFIGKHLCQGLFFNKVAGLRATTLLRKSLWHRECFPVNFVKFLRTPFFIEQLWWLLLYLRLYDWDLSLFCQAPEWYVWIFHCLSLCNIFKFIFQIMIFSRIFSLKIPNLGQWKLKLHLWLYFQLYKK